MTQTSQGLGTLMTPLLGEVTAELVKSGHLLHRILIKKRLLSKAKGSLTPGQEKPRLAASPVLGSEALTQPGGSLVWNPSLRVPGPSLLS